MQQSAREIVTELKLWIRQVFTLNNCWLWIPGLSGIILVYLVYSLNSQSILLQRDFHETIAPYLVASIAFLLVIRSIITRDKLIIYLTLLAVVFLIRELDDTAAQLFGVDTEIKTKKLVSVLLVGMAVLGIIWQRMLFACLNSHRFFKLLLSGMLFSYFFSQVIARRAFRHVLPNEKILHIAMEETSETLSHLLFLGIAVCTCSIYRKYLRGAEKES